MRLGDYSVRAYTDPEWTLFDYSASIGPRQGAPSRRVRLLGRDALRRWTASQDSETRVELRAIDGARLDPSGEFPAGLYHGFATNRSGVRALELLVP